MHDLTEPSEYGNSEGDMGEVLLKARDLREHHVDLISTTETEELDLTEPPAVYMAERNALSYVTGWAACR